MIVINSKLRSTATIALLLAFTAANPALAVANEALCATPAQATTVRDALNKPKPPSLLQMTRELPIPEAVIMSALPTAQAYGVAGSHFQAIWKSLQTWDTAVFVVMKGGHVFETHSKVFPGEPSKRSNYFNLQDDGPGMSGHLRPDLISAIYVLTMPSQDAVTRGVLFYDAKGDIAFGVYLPGESNTPPESLVKQFEATAAEIRALPALCGGRAE